MPSPLDRPTPAPDPESDERRDEQDRVWFAHLRVGDEEAFEALFRRYSPSIYRFVCSYVDAPAIAEEVTQDVFFRLWEHRGQLPAEPEVRVQLFIMARSRALDYLRHDRIVTSHAATAIAAAPQSTPAADQGVVEDELNSALAAAIAELPPRSRLAFVLYWRHGLRYADVAQVMGVSVKTVENQLATALKTLRRRLARFL